MAWFLLRRLWQSVVVLLVMSFVIYGLIGLMPGDPVDIMIAGNPGATPEVAAALRNMYGLDQPLMARYGHWLWEALHGEFGWSRTHSLPVLEVLAPALWQTCKLMVISFVVPVATLALANTGGFIRYVHASMIETLRMAHVRTARAKGAGEARVVLIHGFRNALIPVVPVMALSIGVLFNGPFLTETMFAQPGMGKMIYASILGNDFNLALVGLLFATLITLLLNLVADLAYVWLDPRISP